MTKSRVVSSVAAYPCVHNNPSQLVDSSLIGMLRVGFYTVMFTSTVSYRVIACTGTWTLVEPLTLRNTKLFIVYLYTSLNYIWGVFPHECIVLWVVKTISLSFLGEYVIAQSTQFSFCKLYFIFYTLK